MSERHSKRKLVIFSKGKHVKKHPVKFRKLTIALMVVGVLMVVTSLILEAENYPWGKLLGLGSQNEESVSDPTPLDFPTVSPAAVSSGDLAAVMTILPGAEEEPKEETLEDYNFQVLGIFKIPILKVSQNLLEGSAKQMKFGVGHVTGTAQPGQPGNCVIAGHRPYPFRYLDTLVAGDSIIIKIDKMKYTYQVYDSFEVLPAETWVLNNIWGEKYTLTVITCTPYMVSSHRLIIRARLTDINGQTPAQYYHEEIPETPSPEPAPTDTMTPPPDVSPSPSAEPQEVSPPADAVTPQETEPPQATSSQESESPEESQAPQTSSSPPAILPG